MSLAVYNTLSRSLEEFKPISGKSVKMFVCGQTVYDDAHLGHAKNYIDFDIIARWLRHLGYSLTYIQNITDVDDKIIQRAGEMGISPAELAEKYEKRLMEDMEAIGVKESIDQFPRSHSYMKEIESQIQLLIGKGHAYVAGGDVYYDVDTFKDYTKLSHMKLEELTEHRIEPEEGKRQPYDFALWKASKPGEPTWRITVSYRKKKTELTGRPGWHIEDTAITHSIFGPQYDIHGGAIELLFPHHTNELAQAEAAFGKNPFVKYWLHSGVLNVNGKKMSKSLKNFTTIRDILKRYDSEALRLMVASTHYRKEIDFSEETIKNADKRLRFLYGALGVFYNAENEESGADKESKRITEELKRDFTEAMNHDFDTSLAISALWAAVTESRNAVEREGSIGKGAKEETMAAMLECSGVIGILQHDWYKEAPSGAAMKKIKKREELRKASNFKEADQIRSELSKEGIALEDTEYGTIWRIEKNKRGKPI